MTAYRITAWIDSREYAETEIEATSAAEAIEKAKAHDWSGEDWAACDPADCSPVDFRAENTNNPRDDAECFPDNDIREAAKAARAALKHLLDANPDAAEAWGEARAALAQLEKVLA